MAPLLLAFLAGVLTIAAPCILPLLPVVVGGSLGGAQTAAERWRPVVIAGSLAVSVVVFGILLKTTAAAFAVPQAVWQAISGGIVVLFGVSALWPEVWDRLAGWLGLGRSQALLAQAAGQRGWWRDVLLGAALGPVFNSCSPTYILIVAAILPASFGEGLAYLISYALGLALALLAVAWLGRAATNRLGWFANPHSPAKRVIGAVFIVVGLGIIFGADKVVQTFVLDNGWYAPLSEFEQSLR